MLTAQYTGAMMGLDQCGQPLGTFEEMFAKFEGTTIGAVIIALQFLRPASAVVCGIHGYRRYGDSWGGAAGWSAVGFLLPVLGPLAALFQGYGKEKS